MFFRRMRSWMTLTSSRLARSGRLAMSMSSGSRLSSACGRARCPSAPPAEHDVRIGSSASGGARSAMWPAGSSCASSDGAHGSAPAPVELRVAPRLVGPTRSPVGKRIVSRRVGGGRRGRTARAFSPTFLRAAATFRRLSTIPAAGVAVRCVAATMSSRPLLRAARRNLSAGRVTPPGGTSSSLEGPPCAGTFGAVPSGLSVGCWAFGAGASVWSAG